MIHDIKKYKSIMPSIRWAFNFSKWEPTEKEFLLASSCLQLEEKERIGKFVYKKDAKASLVGRLLIKKFIHENSGIPYKSIKLTRDSNNKPIWNNENLNYPKLSFNISHQGSYAVLAGEIGNKLIGVDVMKLEYTGGKKLNEFFRLMNSNFTFNEWKNIKGFNISEDKQIINFCRHWALKESYVKALGVGITMDLSKIDFHINSELNNNKIINDTNLYINNVKENWIFEESLIDSNHCVSVALEKNKYDFNNSSNDLIFKNIDSNELLKNVNPYYKEDIDYCKKYFLKDEKP